MLIANKHLLKEVDITHAYPHDWRTHKPVIFRATPQWFCSINPIKNMLLEEIKKINWKPKWGYEKMVNMIKDRSDWCISRQRAWGVPLPIIYCEDGTPIIEKEVFDHIQDLFAQYGSNCWYELDEKELLPNNYKSIHSPNNIFHKEVDIMDVWFDSGSSWNGVLNNRKLKYPCDLYLEGNDQYRGWFNASLILSVATNSISPFKTCLTHGWVMDENWQKMSKSAGNGIDPYKVANEFGADLLRLWGASVNYEVDVRISEDIISATSEQYRKIRNTFKFMLSNIDENICLDVSQLHLSFIDKMILSQLEKNINLVLDNYDKYSFSNVSSLLTGFLVDLSSFYLDYAKDILYCDSLASPRRKAIQYVIYNLTHDLLLCFAPILSFTSEEIYSFLPFAKKESVFLEDMVQRRNNYSEYNIAYKKFKKIRDLVLKEIEIKRNDNLINELKEADVSLTIDDEKLFEQLSSLDVDELSRAFSSAEIQLKLGRKIAINVRKTQLETCQRCRNYRDLNSYRENRLCKRCYDLIKETDHE